MGLSENEQKFIHEYPLEMFLAVIRVAMMITKKESDEFVMRKVSVPLKVPEMIAFTLELITHSNSILSPDSHNVDKIATVLGGALASGLFQLSKEVDQEVLTMGTKLVMQNL